MNETYRRFLQAMRGKRVAVVGMGVSNTPLIRLLLKAGAEITVCDRQSRDRLDADLLREFEAAGARFKTGTDYLKDLDHEMIFKTPGMRPDMPELEAARQRGSTVTSEMDVFVHVCPARMIGVTGSDGKTTTTTIIYELLRAAGRHCYIGGNIGTPLLDRADEMTPEDFVVLELSSFQLMTMTKSPDVAVITNLAPNHLDVHKSMAEYIDAKKNIYRYQPEGGRVVLNLDNGITRDIFEELTGRGVGFSRAEALQNGFYCQNGGLYRARGGEPELLLRAEEIKIPGSHNIENYLAALAATDGWVGADAMRQVAKSFGGVAHRMELVRTLHGVRYYNDSIASSPSRTIAGLRAHAQPVILIAGGYDKKIPFDVLGPEIVAHVKRLILVGATSEKIRAAVLAAPGYAPDRLPIHLCSTLEEAVDTAHRLSAPGDIVTLSPACASFDLYKNFEERGEHFRSLVEQIPE